MRWQRKSNAPLKNGPLLLLPTPAHFTKTPKNNPVIKEKPSAGEIPVLCMAAFSVKRGGREEEGGRLLKHVTLTLAHTIRFYFSIFNFFQTCRQAGKLICVTLGLHSAQVVFLLNLTDCGFIGTRNQPGGKRGPWLLLTAISFVF